VNHPQSAGREMDVAIIGMAVRLPGAASVSEFWKNLCDCVESVSFPSKEELRRMGVPPETLRDPRFVGAIPLLKDIDCFDANFFGYSPREAEMLDPQQRLFLECAWESLEAAGYCPNNYDGLIGIYAGASVSSYLLYNLLPNLPDRHSEDNFEAMIGNDKDFLSTRVAYKLNLKGPAITVQTGCSTSLVAVHQACQALLTCQLDMALAGGVSVHVPQRAGYYYQENGINSPDGHCRPFDARSQGTLFGSGMGIVVLKRFADAQQDGDCIHAVIRGSAINNDGAQKVGYTAPSVEGQAAVIHSAQAIAGVEPESISYVECHGTATALGDSVEFQALNKVFGGRTALRQFCALGSVKSNLGHLDAAAGVAGLIKTVLALKNRRLPPSLHFDTPNPGIDFETSPFYVSQKLSPWGNGTSLLRAGVSSFGIGGTNAHVVLEEAPEAGASGPSRSFQLLLLSAKSASALEISTANLIGHLKKENEKELPDTAYTLAVGRKHWAFRRAAICSDIKDAIATLECLDPSRVFTLQHEPSSSPITFMFAGGGAQYVNMGLDLYNSEPLFRQEIDSSAETLGSLLGADIREYMGCGRDKKNRNWAAGTVHCAACAGKTMDELGRDTSISYWAQSG
jgi:phthiocerol/phenolphthiocerol synthesis type-I polyketide synthase E